MKWFECTTEEDLEKIGSYETIKKTIECDFDETIEIKTSNLPVLFKTIEKIKKLLTKEKDGFFCGEAEKFIFSLTELDGKNRQKILGVTNLHYKNKDIADQWKKKIASKIHEDRCKLPEAKDAWNVLMEMYEEMVE